MIVVFVVVGDITGCIGTNWGWTGINWSVIGTSTKELIGLVITEKLFDDEDPEPEPDPEVGFEVKLELESERDIVEVDVVVVEVEVAVGITTFCGITKPYGITIFGGWFDISFVITGDVAIVLLITGETN